MIPSGTAPIHLTASFRADDREGKEVSTVTEVELKPGSMPGAADCLGPGQSFSSVAGVYLDYVFVDEFPELIHRVAPDYPRSALARGFEQVIVVQTLVCKSGNVLDAQALPVRRDPPEENDPKLVEAAVAAVRQYVFRPASVNGQAVAVVVHVSVKFPPPAPDFERGGGVVVAEGAKLASDVPSRTALAPVLVHRFDAPQGAVGFAKGVGAADFNSDGIPDLVVGGNPTFVYSGADQELLLTIPGSDDFGVELDVVGDVEGTGGPDLLIATSSHARLYSGQTGSLVPFHSYIYDAGDDQGTSMVSMGDIDGDGRGDFVIGEENFGETPRATVWSGLDSRSLVRVYAGHSVTALGDVNGDGIPDFAAGRYGLIHVVSGAIDDEGKTLFTVPGYDASLGAADINGDGIKDLLLMQPQGSPNGAIGVVHAFSGVNGDTLGRVAVPAIVSTMGCFFRGLVCGIGDIDGDGKEEFAASTVCGYTSFGPGTVCVFSGATLARMLHLTGPSPTAAFGYSLAAPGDVDGDGRPDLLIGAPGLSTHPNRPLGAAFLYRLVHDVVAIADPPPVQLRLKPNPVRRGTPIAIGFATTTEPHNARFIVLDIAGRVVRQLGPVLGGNLIWDGRDEHGRLVRPGVYFVRSATGTQSMKVAILD